MKKTSKLLLLWYSHPRVAIALMLTGVNLIVILLFTVILALISGNGFFDELSYLFTYTMCSDGIYDFVNNQEDVACFIVKIILTVLQMVIFSGALIGFATDILQTTFDKRLENKDKLYLKNHFVFLNWSAIGQNIIYDLSFLEGEKTVVILSENEREDVINSIDNIFTASGRSKKGLRIFVKKGDPHSSKHLSDISISQAKHIGILLSDKDNISQNNVSTNDLEAFKLLLCMMGLAPEANFVVETESEIAKEKIEKLISATYPEKKEGIAVFSHNAVMGYILGKATINPIYSVLLHEVLSFDGVEFYGIPQMDVEEALYTYNGCIPIINYDDDDAVNEAGEKEADQLYVLSDTAANLGRRVKKTSFVKEIPYYETSKEEEFTLFIFSDSNRIDFVISELNTYNRQYKSKINYKLFSYDSDFSQKIQEILSVEGEKKVLLLSDGEEGGDEQDSSVFMSLLELKANPEICKEVDIFVEIINLDNLLAVKNLGIASVILSNRIISLYMLQLLTHGKSRKFFRDVLVSDDVSGGLDFEIGKAKNYFDFSKGNIEFHSYSELIQSFYMASNKRKMLVGYCVSNESKIQYFCEDMDALRKISILPDDQLIMVAYR